MVQVGMKVNDWTCIGISEKRYKSCGHKKIFRWQCECGEIKEALLSDARAYKSCKICGHKARCKYGIRTRSLPLYDLWRGMLKRCYSLKSNSYKQYGGRGIKVCERWHKYENFASDVGIRQPGMQLDRINNDGDYKPSNCRWVTRSENLMNRRCSPKYSDKYIFKVICKNDLCEACRTKVLN